MTGREREREFQGLPRPNFLIVGASKAGTTSLYEYLRQHPDIFMPEDPKKKEPAYFVANRPGIKDFDTYLALFRDAAGKKAIGEASTAYLYSEESPGLIRSVLGEVKIIIILRNPAKRAFSMYQWMIREGWEDACSFEEALRREPVRLSDPGFLNSCLEGWPESYMYFTTGLYGQQLERYFRLFGREKVRVYLFEEFVTDPLRTCIDIFEYLGVDKRFVPQLGVHNEGRRPVSVGLQFWIQNVMVGRPCPSVLKVVPTNLCASLLKTTKHLNMRFGHKTKMNHTTYKRLVDLYRSDIAKVEELLKRDLSGWYTK
jgi:hypothetical protein